MNAFGDPVEILNDPQVKNVFLAILESEFLSAEEKYQKFVDFFEQESRIRSMMLSHADQIKSGGLEDINKILSQVCQKAGIWNPQGILQQTEDSIKRAIRRLKNSWHEDGGWGFYAPSDFWETALTVLCLNSAKTFEHIDPDVDIDKMLKSGLNWLEDRPWTWSVTYIAPTGRMSVYHVFLITRLFYQVGGAYFTKSSSAVARCIDKLADSQNEDGGWDADIWGPQVPTPTRVWSEVGATSNAVRALAETKNKTYRPIVEKALEWLANTQNADGSWNDGSCARERKRFELGGHPHINKTCDALRGILVGQDFDIALEPFKERIDKAIAWLQRQEKPMQDTEGGKKGWGWGYKYESTCLTLETLLIMPDASLPLLTANAQWLMENQYKEDEVEDVKDVGKWSDEHTARIALSLIEYYKIIKASPLFSLE